MPKQRVDVTVLRWYEKRSSATDVISRWLTAARTHLPDAVPVRFGDTEPLRGRLDTDDGLNAAFQRADGLFFLRCTPPVMDASLGTPNVPRYWGRTMGHSLSTLLPAHDERLRRFVLAFAGPATIYASASLAKGMILDRGQLVGPAEDPGERYLAPLGNWHGPPPEPPAWCWFGSDYSRRVRRHVNAETSGTGLLWTGGPWIPDRFRARFDEPEPSHRVAPRMPRGLR